MVFADMNEESAKASSEESTKYATNKEYLTSTFVVNVKDAKVVEDMVNFVVEKYGRLDYCVNAAGVCPDCFPCSVVQCQLCMLTSVSRSTTVYIRLSRTPISMFSITS